MDPNLLPDAGEASGLHQLDGRPIWTAADVGGVARGNWGLDVARVRPLVSERDQNWEIHTRGGTRLVLKVANSGDEVGDIELQQKMMRLLTAAGIPCPRPQASADGDLVVRERGHLVWIIDFLEGAVLASVGEPSDALLSDLGLTVGQLTNALDDFDHPAAHRWLQWDVQHADKVLGAYKQHVADDDDRALVDNVHARFVGYVHPWMGDLESGVIHNDANDHNILTLGDSVSGLIDFGDAVHSIRVNDLAIACAYAMLDAPDPHAARRQIVDGYERVRPLEELEAAVLPDLIKTRLATSVSISAFQARQSGADDYLSISEGPAWRLLKRLDGELDG